MRAKPDLLNNEQLSNEIDHDMPLEAKIDSFFKHPMPIDVREERLAQWLLDKPRESVAWLVGFEEHLRETPSIALMLERDPSRAEFKIMNHIRKPSFAAITTLAFNRTVEAMLSLIENEESPCPMPDTSPYTIEWSDAIHTEDNEVYTDNAAAFIHGLSGLLRRGWNDTLLRLKDPNNDYNTLWECFEAAHDCFMSHVGIKNFSAEQQCYFIVEDNAFVALELLTHVRQEYAEECALRGIQPSAYGALYKALGSADELGQAATGNSEAIGKVIGSDRLARHLPILELSTPEEHLAMRPRRKRLAVPSLHDSRFFRYNHPSLKNGPWEPARFCPAVPWLQSNDPYDQKIISDLDSHLTRIRRQYAPEDRQNEPHEPDLTLYIRSTLLLKIGALIAHETIFKDWA